VPNLAVGFGDDRRTLLVDLAPLGNSLAANGGASLSVAGGYLALSQSPKDAPSLDGWSFVAALSAIGGLTGWILVKTAYQQSVAR